MTLIRLRSRECLFFDRNFLFLSFCLSLFSFSGLSLLFFSCSLFSSPPSFISLFFIFPSFLFFRSFDVNKVRCVKYVRVFVRIRKKIAFCVPWAKRMTCSHVIKFQENCDLCFLCHVNHFESTEGENTYASEVIVILESKLVVLSLQSELEFTQEISVLERSIRRITEAMGTFQIFLKE